MATYQRYLKNLEKLGLLPFKYDPRDKAANTRAKIAYMLDRTQGMFDWTGLPDTIPQRDLELLLQTGGFACITEVKGCLYAFFGGLGGEPNPYYMPTICTVANPALNFSGELRIDEECVIIPNDACYQGLMPLMSYYATQLSENELSLYIGMINTRMLAVITTDDDNQKAAADVYFQNLEEGKLGALGQRAFLEGIKVQPYGSQGAYSNLINLITIEQYLNGRFYNEMGIDANPNMKRTVTTSAELEKNNQVLVPLAINMLESRQTACDKINKMYGTNISVDLSDIWKENTEEELKTPDEKEEEKEEEVQDNGGTE